MSAFASCPACGQTKPTAEFRVNRSAKSGRARDCLSCVSERQKRRWTEMDPATKALKIARMQARYRTGVDGDRLAALYAAREAERRLIRATCFWHLVAMIHLGPLAVALREQAEGRRRAACVRASAWLAANHDRATVRARAYRMEKRHLHRAWSRKYQTAKLNAVPAWANHDAIARIYEFALALAEATGEPWHVDHRVPLQHPLVCGLHCEANLQPVPARLNLSKGNRHWPDMPDAIKT